MITYNIRVCDHNIVLSVNFVCFIEVKRQLFCAASFCIAMGYLLKILQFEIILTSDGTDTRKCIGSTFTSSLYGYTERLFCL